MLQQYVLQRDWSSRSCTTMNRIGNTSVPVSFCATATMAATMSRTHFHHHRPPDDVGQSATPTSGDPPPSPSPCRSTGQSASPTPSAPPMSTNQSQQSSLVYDSDNMSANAINTITLPNFRHFDKMNTMNNGNNVVLNPNFPKSISTWGPLHKNLHWKVGFCLRVFSTF